ERLVIVQSGPRAQVVPAKAGAETVEIRGVLPLGRARLQERIVNADVFAFPVEGGEFLLEVARIPGLRNLLEIRCAFREMLTQRLAQRAHAPNEHPAVPVVIT